MAPTSARLVSAASTALRGGGWIRPVILEDGIVVGGWRSSRKGGRLEITLNLPKAERDRLGAKIDAEVAEVGARLAAEGDASLSRVDVATAIADAEIASEIYSTAGGYDLLVKFYLNESEDVGHFVSQTIQTIPGIRHWKEAKTGVRT